MGNYSPLRYPGGKSALYPAISGIIKSNKMDHCIYVEPFAGGANIAWSEMCLRQTLIQTAENSMTGNQSIPNVHRRK